MEKCKVDFESLPWESPMEGVRSKTYKHDERQLRLVEFTREFAQPDWCTKGHCGYVLEGKLQIDFNGEIVVFIPGDGIFIPEGEGSKHSAKVLTETVKVILVEDG